MIVHLPLRTIEKDDFAHLIRSTPLTVSRSFTTVAGESSNFTWSLAVHFSTGPDPNTSGCYRLQPFSRSSSRDNFAETLSCHAEESHQRAGSIYFIITTAPLTPKFEQESTTLLRVRTAKNDGACQIPISLRLDIMQMHFTCGYFAWLSRDIARQPSSLSSTKPVTDKTTLPFLTKFYRETRGWQLKPAHRTRSSPSDAI